MDLIWLECRSHVLDLNVPIRFESPMFLHLAWKAVHSIQMFFPLLLAPPTIKMQVTCETTVNTGW